MTSILGDFVSAIAARVPLAGRQVLDVGCGDGAFARELARAGARVTGIECSEAQLELCRGAAPVAGERYLPGVGEDLPFEDDSFDATVFRASLHHVPAASMAAALAEARRVTRPTGEIFVFEPLTTGTHFQLTRLVDDETEVRGLAQQAMDRAVADGWLARTYGATLDSESVYADFEALRKRIVAIDAGRERSFATAEGQLRRVFEGSGVACATGRSFDQPFRFDVFR